MEHWVVRNIQEEQKILKLEDNYKYKSMGIFSRSRTLKSTDKKKKQSGGFLNGIIDGAVGTGKYAKTDEQKQKKKESRTLPSRLGGLRLKKYNRSMAFRFNDNKNRIEVGDSFVMNKLPEIVYLLADRSTTFRRAIGGTFDFSEREKLRRIIRKKRNRVQRMERQLGDGMEKKQQVYLKDLF